MGTRGLMMICKGFVSSAGGFALLFCVAFVVVVVCVAVGRVGKSESRLGINITSVKV